MSISFCMLYTLSINVFMFCTILTYHYWCVGKFISMLVTRDSVYVLICLFFLWGWTSLHLPVFLRWQMIAMSTFCIVITTDVSIYMYQMVINSQCACLFQWLLRRFPLLQESVSQDRVDQTTVLGVVSHLWIQADRQVVPTVLLLLQVDSISPCLMAMKHLESKCIISIKDTTLTTQHLICPFLCEIKTIFWIKFNFKILFCFDSSRYQIYFLY